MPYTNGVNKTPSAKNLALFSNLLIASSSVSFVASLSKPVPTPGAISPKVPISSIS